MSTVPKILVIDASIAHAAGGKDAQHPTSVYARDFLRNVLDFGHNIGMTPAIQEEWNRHQSNFSLQWRKTMVAKKKFIARPISEDIELRNKIAELPVSANKKAAMTKDCHLLEAALAFDQRIASKDDTVHELFKTASDNIEKIRSLVWTNPIQNPDAVRTWLKQGAPNKMEWQLRT